MSKLVSREAMMAVIAHHIDPLQSGTAAFIKAIRDIPSVDSGSDLQARYDALQAKVSEAVKLAKRYSIVQIPPRAEPTFIDNLLAILSDTSTECCGKSAEECESITEGTHGACCRRCVHPLVQRSNPFDTSTEGEALNVDGGFVCPKCGQGPEHRTRRRRRFVP